MVVKLHPGHSLEIVDDVRHLELQVEPDGGLAVSVTDGMNGGVAGVRLTREEAGYVGRFLAGAG